MPDSNVIIRLYFDHVAERSPLCGRIPTLPTFCADAADDEAHEADLAFTPRVTQIMVWYPLTLEFWARLSLQHHLAGKSRIDNFKGGVTVARKPAFVAA